MAYLAAFYLERAYIFRQVLYLSVGSDDDLDLFDFGGIYQFRGGSQQCIRFLSERIHFLGILRKISSLIASV